MCCEIFSKLLLKNQRRFLKKPFLSVIIKYIETTIISLWPDTKRLFTLARPP